MSQHHFYPSGRQIGLWLGIGALVGTTSTIAPSFTQAATNPELTGTWTLVEWSDGASNIQRPLPSAPVTAVFSGAQVSGSTGCNRYTGSYQVLNQQVLSVSPLASTKRACLPPVMKQESAYLTALQLARAYSFTPSGQLKIAFQSQAGNGVMVFQQEPSPQKPMKPVRALS